MIGYLRDLICWFFHGHVSVPPEPDQESPPINEDPRKDPVDNRPPSEKIIADIFEAVKGQDILNEMRHLESATHKYQKAREDLIREIRNINPRRFN